MDGLFQLDEKLVLILAHRHMADIRPGDHETVGVDRIGRVGHQDRVAGTGGGQRQVGQALLGTQGDDRLGGRVQVHIVAALVPVTDSLAQARDALGLGVAVGIAAARGFHQLVDDMVRRGLVGIAHAEIDDVLAGRPGLLLQFTDDIEHIGRQALDAPKLVRPRLTTLLTALAGRDDAKKGEKQY